MELRRAANAEINSLRGATTDVDADCVEGRARDRIVALSRAAFKKVPDEPLGVVVERKISYREKRSNKNGHAAYQRGREAMDSGELDSAIESLKQSVEIEPHFKTFELLGECHIRRGKPHEAIASLTSSVSFGNKPFRALYLLAQALEASGRRNEAIQRLEQAVAMKPDFKAAHDLLGVLLRASAK